MITGHSLPYTAAVYCRPSPARWRDFPSRRIDMATVAELMAGSAPAALAARLGQSPAATLAATGSTQADAAAITSSFTLISTAPASTGVLLKQANGQPVTVIYNGGANTMKIDTDTTEKINNIAGSTGISVPTAKGAILIADGNQWIGIVSA